MTKAPPHRIIFANEKGGTGKSTCAVHFAVALASQGWRVAGIDLDPRQRTFHRYLENRTNTAKRRGIDLPMPQFEVFEGSTVEELDEQVARLADGVDYFVADTPGRDDGIRKPARCSHAVRSSPGQAAAGRGSPVPCCFPRSRGMR